MFLTYQHAKIHNLGLFGEEPTAWTYVEHNIHRPWFYVAMTEAADGFDLHPMLMLSNERFLQSLMSDQKQGMRMESVLLVTPDHVNHSGRWMMEPLESVERFESPDGVAYAYLVQGEKTYIYGELEVVSLQSAQRETLFNNAMLSCDPD